MKAPQTVEMPEEFVSPVDKVNNHGDRSWIFSDRFKDIAPVRYMTSFERSLIWGAGLLIRVNNSRPKK
jgi:hypothetical protein